MSRIYHPAHNWQHPDPLIANARMDDGNLFLPLQLEHLSTKVLNKVFPSLKYALAFDVVADPPLWDDTSYALVTQEFTGDPITLGADFADMGPRVSLSRGKQTTPVVPLTNHYGFTDVELSRCLRLGIPLTSDLAMKARRQIEFGIDQRAFKGDSALGIPGLLSNLSAIAINAVAANGAVGASPLWSTKTYLEIIRDITRLFSAIEEATLGIEELRPNRLGMCTGLQAIMAMKPNDLGTMSVRMYIEAALKSLNPDFEIFDSFEFNNINGHAGMVMYRKDPDCVGHIFARGYTEDAPMHVNRETIIGCTAVTGGVEVRQPKSIGWLYGIAPDPA